MPQACSNGVHEGAGPSSNADKAQAHSSGVHEGAGPSSNADKVLVTGSFDWAKLLRCGAVK